MALNRVFLQGRIGTSLELKQTQTGVSVLSFRLAVDRDFKDKNSGERVTDWIDVTAWRGTADFISRYFSKGRSIIIDGHLQTREWEDKDGNKRRVTEVIAESVYFGDSKRSEDTASDRNAPENAIPPTPASDFTELPDEDGELPFK